MQLWKATTENGSHPFAKFATGSYETLMSRPKVRTTIRHASKGSS